MPINRVDPQGMPMSAAEFRAAGLADRKKAMADYVAHHAAVDARTALLRSQRLAGDRRAFRHVEAKADRTIKNTAPTNLSAEERRPDLFMAGDPVKRRVGI